MPGFARLGGGGEVRVGKEGGRKFYQFPRTSSNHAEGKGEGDSTTQSYSEKKEERHRQTISEEPCFKTTKWEGREPEKGRHLGIQV